MHCARTDETPLKNVRWLTKVIVKSIFAYLLWSKQGCVVQGILGVGCVSESLIWLRDEVVRRLRAGNEGGIRAFALEERNLGRGQAP